MRQLTILALMLTTFAVVAPTIFAGPQDGDWVDLFDGKSLEGWTQRGGAAHYDVIDGMIVGSTVPNTPNSFLCTDTMYTDFELELEFKVHPELNSGIQIRSNSLESYQDGRVHGYQVEIDPSDRAWSGGIYDEARRGWLNDLRNNNAARYAFKQGDWNHLRIRAVGDRIQSWLNGVAAADLTDSMTGRGFIALQVHGVGGRQDKLTVQWRNLRIKENPSIIEHEQDESDDSGDLLQSTEKTPGIVFVDSDGGEIKKLAGGFRFTEGPALGPDGQIYFNDIPNETTHVFDPETGATKVFRRDTGSANGLFWTANDALICCEGGRRQLTRIWKDQVDVLANEFEGKKLNSPNDLVLDTAGGIYFTDPRYGSRDNLELDVEGVYYVNTRKQIFRVIDDMKRPNGLIMSPDFRTLYVADHGDAKTWAYDVSGEGQLTGKRLFAEIGSDGMTIDQAGNVYLTWRDSIAVYSAGGKEIAQRVMPEAPTNCLLVGKTLYVTARTSLYAIETEQQGLFD